jgi:D-alanyl-D-alanine dipeptidase
VRNFFNGFHENGATAPELFYYIRIVDDFVVYVDGVAVGFEGQFDDIYSADHACAEATGTHAQKHFSIGFGRHLLPKSVVYQHSIIPYGRQWPHFNSLFC